MYPLCYCWNPLCPGLNRPCSCPNSLFFRLNSPLTTHIYSPAALNLQRRAGVSPRMVSACACEGLSPDGCQAGDKKVEFLGMLHAKCRGALQELLRHEEPVGGESAGRVRAIVEKDAACLDRKKTNRIAYQEKLKTAFQERLDDKFMARSKVRCNNFEYIINPNTRSMVANDEVMILSLMRQPKACNTSHFSCGLFTANP